MSQVVLNVLVSCTSSQSPLLNFEGRQQGFSQNSHRFVAGFINPSQFDGKYLLHIVKIKAASFQIWLCKTQLCLTCWLRGANAQS